MRGIELEIQRPSPDAIPSSRPETEQREHLLQYLAGYFDAAASVTIDHHRGLYKGQITHSFVLRVEICRVQPEIIDFIHQVFPAYKGKRYSETMPERTRWYAKTSKAMEALDTLAPYLRIKRDHVELARKFYDATGNRTTDESLRFKEEMSALNHREVSEVKTPFEIPYIAGFFDAHGAINVHQKPSYLQLEVDTYTHQKEFIAALARQLGINSRGDYGILLSANRAKGFLMSIVPFLKIQRKSAELAIEFQNNRTPPVLQKDTAQRRAREEKIVAQLEEEYRSIHKIRRKPKLT